MASVQKANPVIASAPGKVILFGEHAVVYGKKALAAAIDLRTYVYLQPLPTPSAPTDAVLTIDCFDLDSYVTLPKAWLDQLELQRPYLLPSSVSLPQSCSLLPSSPPAFSLDLLTSLTHLTSHFTPTSTPPSPPFMVVVYLYFLFSFSTSLHLSFRSTIPIASGLGSSASFSVALSAALLTHLQPQMKMNERAFELLVNEYAYLAECIFHGQPSGLDNTIVTMGGMVSYQREWSSMDIQSPMQVSPKDTKETELKNMIGNETKQEKEEINLSHINTTKKTKMTWEPITLDSPIPCMLVHTHIPKHTPTMVQKVRTLYTHYPSLIDSFMETLHRITLQAMHFQFNEWMNLIPWAQSTLHNLKVSHESIEQIVELAKQHNCVAKLVGAGGGGCVWVYTAPPTPPPSSSSSSSSLSSSWTSKYDAFQTALLNSALPYTPYLTQLGSPGVKVYSLKNDIKDIKTIFNHSTKEHMERWWQETVETNAIREHSTS